MGLRILYGVQGTGNGHISRSREIIRHLKAEGHDVEVIVRPVGPSKPAPLCETLSPEEWKKVFHAWVESHDRDLPVLPEEALRREGIYEDRL